MAEKEEKILAKGKIGNLFHFEEDNDQEPESNKKAKKRRHKDSVQLETAFRDDNAAPEMTHHTSLPSQFSVASTVDTKVDEPEADQDLPEDTVEDSSDMFTESDAFDAIPLAERMHMKDMGIDPEQF